MKTMELDLETIETNENSRVNFKEQELAELMGSIKEYGLLEPIGLRYLENNRYETIYGNRRLEAVRKLGWPTITGIIYKDITDTDRDLMNLQENMKRANTTAYEDGRMFTSLIDRGLSIPELAVRLGVPRARIETAIDCFKELPKEFQKKVVYNRKGGTTKDGTVGASAAGVVLNLQKNLKLTREDSAKLMKYAAEEGTSMLQLRQVAPLVKEGYDVETAIDYAKHYKPVRLDVLMDKTVIRKLEKENRKGITDILLDYLATNKAFKLRKRRGQARFSVHKQNFSRTPVDAGSEVA